MKIAVVGAGISGLSAAWLLSKTHDVTLYEAADRLGGHSQTIDAPTPSGSVPVDMGFIVYNAVNYPNLVALFDHLGVPTQLSNMGFAVSLDGGRVEYGGDNLATLFGQARNLVSPRFWRMLRDLVRFYRQAPLDAPGLEISMATLGEYLDAGGYGPAFQDDHLLPQAAAIWSASVKNIRDYPAAAFIRFFENHGLLKIADRTDWRTVTGGSRTYVAKLAQALHGKVRLGAPAASVTRDATGVLVQDDTGAQDHYDHVVMATHADTGLGLITEPTRDERRILSAFGYSRNRTVLHSDPLLMPRRRGVWSAWNYVGADRDGGLCVTYWMNRLQDLPPSRDLFVTLNPTVEPELSSQIHTEIFHHPVFDTAALRAQRELWSLQGVGGLWWCGAYFGSGFHEDGLQAGLAVAEALGGVRRPWTVAHESGRIIIEPAMDRAA